MIEAARKAIDFAWSVAQTTANDLGSVQSWLNVKLANTIQNGVTFVATATDFVPAEAGTTDKPEGTNGSFKFDVLLSYGKTSHFYSFTGCVMAIQFTEGANSTWNGTGEQQFVLSANYSDFDGSVYVDEILLTRNVDYTDGEGSTKINLQPSFLGGLAAGTHTLKVMFRGGIAATTMFTVVKGFPAPVRDDATLAEFYTVNVTSGEGGRVSPAGSTRVPTGGEFTFTVTPDAGYKIDLVLLDVANITRNLTDNTYTISDVCSDYNVRVSFAKADAAEPAPEFVEVVATAEIPQTGDGQTPAGFVMLTAAVVAAGLFVCFRRRKRG